MKRLCIDNGGDEMYCIWVEKQINTLSVYLTNFVDILFENALTFIVNSKIFFWPTDQNIVKFLTEDRNYITQLSLLFCFVLFSHPE